MVVKPVDPSASRKKPGHDHIPATIPPPDSSASFWHSQPSEFLFGHRTTPQLPEEADIVIVGSGITGTSIALFLSELHGLSDGSEACETQKESKVVMLDAREACWGATGRNGGHLQPLVYNRSPSIGEFELENCRYVAEFIRENKIPCEYRAVSGCKTFWSDETWLPAEQAVKKLRADHPNLGKKVKIVESADAEGMGRHCILGGCKGATLTEGAASLWPYKYVTWILEKLIKEGKLSLQTNTPVLSVTPTSCASADAEERSQRWTLQTERGSITAKNVILATNGWTTALLPHLSDLLVPVRGTMSALLPPCPSNKTLLPNSYGFQAAGPCPEADSEEYLTQRPFEGVEDARGHLMFGGGRVYGVLPTRNVSDDYPVDETTVAYLRGILPELLNLPGIKHHGPQSSHCGGPSDDLSHHGLELVQAWSGIMGYSRDNAPWVGGLPGMSGIWLCAGYTGHGMPNATLCGRALVNMMKMSGALALASPGEKDGRLSAQDAGIELVRKGELPAAYLITEHRMKLARQLPTVVEQDIANIPCCLAEIDLLKAWPGY